MERVVDELVPRLRRAPPVALTIAGSDSGGGAGIEADLKTFAAIGVHGTAAITSLTAQNTLEVRAIQDASPEMVVAQVEAVADDLGVDAAKTGMLSNAGIIEAVARVVDRYGFPLVVDPVMVAKSGARLLREDAVDALKERLLPLATIVTPNRMEAEVLWGRRIGGLDDAVEAGRFIRREYGPRIVVVKGGHVSEESEESIDVVVHEGGYELLRAPRVREGCTHGTGCSFSAAIAAHLALGLEPLEALRRSKEFITRAIEYGFRVGRGHCPVNPSHHVDIDAHRYRVLEALWEAFEGLSREGERAARLVPEVRMNIAMALPAWYVRGLGDVAGFPGRIAAVEGRVAAFGAPRFGESRYLASLIIAAMARDWRIRAAVNARLLPGLVENAREKGLPLVRTGGESDEEAVRRAHEAMEGLEKKPGAPLVVVDEGGRGREPGLVVLAPDAREAVELLLGLSPRS